MSPPVRSCVHSARMGYHLRPALSTMVRSASYCPSRPPPFSICNPIISAYLCHPSPSFAIPCRPASPPRLHPPPPSPLFHNICLPLSPSSFSFSSASKSVCLLPELISSSNPLHFIHPPPLSVLFYGPSAAIISPPPQHRCLLLISTTSTIGKPYNLTHPLTLYLTPLYFYLSILVLC